MSKSNEGRCCDAVLRILEAEHAATRKDVIRDTPEKRGIEIACTIGAQHYALEHTLIEPFPENKRDNIALVKVLDDNFANDISSLLRPEFTYNLNVDVYAFRNFGTKTLKLARNNLLEWARAAVPRLPVPSRNGPPETRVYGEPPAAPVRVILACHRSTLLGGKLLFGRIAPPDLEQLRSERLLKALEDKGPKLHAARRAGTRTVLIAENSDIALTNASSVGKIFANLAAHISHMPDDIYIVDTGTGNFYYVTQVCRAGKPCLIMGTKLGDWEYKVKDLADI